MEFDVKSMSEKIDWEKDKLDLAIKKLNNHLSEIWLSIDKQSVSYREVDGVATLEWAIP